MAMLRAHARPSIRWRFKSTDNALVLANGGYRRMVYERWSAVNEGYWNVDKAELIAQYQGLYEERLVA